MWVPVCRAKLTYSTTSSVCCSGTQALGHGVRCTMRDRERASSHALRPKERHGVLSERTGALGGHGCKAGNDGARQARRHYQGRHVQGSRALRLRGWGGCATVLLQPLGRTFCLGSR